MKVLIAIHYFPPHMGGMENVAATQARMLAQRGETVTVLTSAAAAPAGVSSENGYRIMRVAVWNYFEKAMGVPFPIFAPSLLWKSFKLVRDCDVVHTHDAFYLSSLAVAFWAKTLGKPLVLTQHVDMIPHPKKIVRAIQHIVYKTTGKFVLRCSHRIAVLNSNVRNFLTGIGIAAGKVIFMPNGVDTNLFFPDDRADTTVLRQQYGLPVGKKIALFVGRFVPKKGFLKLLEAGSSEYVIAFAGGSAPEGYEHDTRFVFLGAIKPEALAEVYRAVDMFILPSEGEGFPLTVQEAMASGLPLIISDHPGYDVYELDKDLVMTIRPDVSAICAALQKLTHDTSLRQRMGTYSAAYARQHFSWDINIDHLQSVYNEAPST